jgi:hypothetical protein
VQDRREDLNCLKRLQKAEETKVDKNIIESDELQKSRDKRRQKTKGRKTSIESEEAARWRGVALLMSKALGLAPFDRRNSTRFIFLLSVAACNGVAL